MTLNTATSSVHNTTINYENALNALIVSVVSVEENAPKPEFYSEDFLPPWAVAVIVIGLASVAFVIVFGVSMVSVASDGPRPH